MKALEPTLNQGCHDDSRRLAMAGRSLDMVEPNPIHGRLLVLVLV
jgi:hypothetical protein